MSRYSSPQVRAAMASLTGRARNTRAQSAFSAVPASALSEDDTDADGDELIARIAHALGVDPDDFVAASLRGISAVESLRDFVPQPTAFALTTAKTTTIAGFDLVSASEVTFSVASLQNGVFLKDGITLTAFLADAAGATGEQLRVKVYGRGIYPHERLAQVGQPVHIPWTGPIDNGTHYIGVACPQAAASPGHVRIELAANSVPPSIDLVRVGRRQRPTLSALVRGRSMASKAEVALSARREASALRPTTPVSGGGRRS